MVFRTLFNEPRPKGFLEIGEVLEELDIDPDDTDHVEVVIDFSDRTGPKFNEVNDGFFAEVTYSDLDENDEECLVSFTTLGYRDLKSLTDDLCSVGFVPPFLENLLTQERGIVIRDEPDAPEMIIHGTDKASDFAQLRAEAMEPAILKYKEETEYSDHPSELPPTHLTTNKEKPDMTFNRDIYELANALNSSVLRLQTELLETNRLALALTQKIGNQAFEDQEPQRSELTISIDASPLTQAIEELVSKVSTGLDATAQTAVEGAGYVETKEIIEDAANKATEEVIKSVEASLPQESDDFDAAVEAILSKGVEQELAVEVPAEAPQPLPTPENTETVTQAVSTVQPHLDQSDDAKDFRAIASFFLNKYSGARDGLLIEAQIFNTTWDHINRRIAPELSKHLIKVPTSKMIWTQRLNSLFKKNVGEHIDAVLYGSTNPVTMRLDRETNGHYSFIKV